MRRAVGAVPAFSAEAAARAARAIEKQSFPAPRAQPP